MNKRPTALSTEDTEAYCTIRQGITVGLSNVHPIDEQHAIRNAQASSNDKTTFFIASIKAHIDNRHINEFINFPSILHNIDINIHEPTLGSYMINYFTDRDQKIGQSERMLTRLLSTRGEFVPFSSYYLWFLIDRCHFIGIQNITIVFGFMAILLQNV